MPLIEDDEEEVVIHKPVDIVGPDYRGSIVDTDVTPHSEIMAYVEGSPWNTVYYSQLVGRDDELGGQQVNQPAVYQQYTMIIDMELKVTSPLTQSQDTETNEMTVVGTANIYGGVIPNVGDMFLADIGDGREGVLTVTRSEKKSILKGAGYTIDYELTDYNTEERRKDLAKKVVRTVYFRKDYILYGRSPVITAEDLNLRKQAMHQLFDLRNTYFPEFFSHEYMTLIVPNQQFSSYDPFLTKLLMKIFDSTEHPLLNKTRLLNIDGDPAMNCFTVWDALLSVDDALLSVAAKEVYLVSTNYFSLRPYHNSIAHSGINRVVYPVGIAPAVDANYVARCSKVGTDVLGGQTDPINDYQVITVVEGQPLPPDWEPGPGIPLIKPVAIDDHYVFSQDFYNKAEEGQSMLEIITNVYLSGGVPDHKVLMALCEDVRNWGALERYYYVPVLMILLLVATRRN